MSRAWWTVPGPDGGILELRQVDLRLLGLPRCWYGSALPGSTGVS
jgi:hypothetical protein